MTVRPLILYFEFLFFSLCGTRKTIVVIINNNNIHITHNGLLPSGKVIINMTNKLLSFVNHLGFILDLNDLNESISSRDLVFNSFFVS